MARHVRTGDTVVVTSGDHKGKTGEVMRIDIKSDRVYVKGVNLRTKHMKPTRVNPQGGVVTIEGPIHMSNVSPVADGKPTRVKYDVAADGSKTRTSVRTGKALPVMTRRKGGETGKSDSI